MSAIILPVDSTTERARPANTIGTPRQSTTDASGPAAKVAVWHWLVALVDQALVSGTRFLATIILGRFCGPGELGTYSLAFSLLVLGGCFQEAIITTPYAVVGQRLRRRSRETYAGAVARMHLTAAVGSALVLVSLAFVGIIFQIPGLPAVASVLAVTLPCSLAVEFVRRLALADLNVRAAAWLDATVAGIQIFLLILLAQLKWLDARIALFAVGIAYGTPAIVWWTRYGKHRVRSAASAAIYWRRNWKLGRWLVASQAMAVIHGFIPIWLLALIVDTHATGRFMAYMNLALLSNPLIFTVGNLLIPRAAQTLARNGRQQAQRLVLTVLLCFVALMTFFAVGLHFAGHAIVQLVYGESFAGLEKVAGMLGLTAIMWAISGTCASGLVAFGRPRWGFIASCTGSIVTALSVMLLAPTYSVYGATLGVLLGNSTAAAVHTWAFIRASGGLRAEPAAPSHNTYENRFAIQDLTNA